MIYGQNVTDYLDSIVDIFPINAIKPRSYSCSLTELSLETMKNWKCDPGISVCFLSLSKERSQIYKCIHFIGSCSDLIIEIIAEHPLQLVEHTEKVEFRSMRLETVKIWCWNLGGVVIN